MKKDYFIIFCACILVFNISYGQTTINAGVVSGTWTKAGSPYKINGDIYVAQGQTFRINSGVKVEFQGTYTLHVWGSIQAIGAPGDTVVFTGKNPSTLWKGVYIHKTQAGSDSNLIKYCLFQFTKHLDYVQTPANAARGALKCDTVSNISIENSRFYKNISNIGAGIRGLRSNLQIKNCLFHYNIAIDERTSLPAGAYGGGSAIVLGIGTVVIENCEFRNNLSHAPNDPKDTTVGLGQGVVVLTDASLTLINTNFVDNKCTQGYTIRLAPILSNTKTFLFRNCDFVNNTNGFEPLFQIDNGGQYTGIQTTIENCRFIGNSITRGDFKPICFGVYNQNGIGNKINIKNCLFYNNSSLKIRGEVIRMSNFVDATIFNCRFIGNKAIGINYFRNGKLRIDNTIFANNYIAFWAGLQTATSDIVINNSAIVNNGVPSSDSTVFKGPNYFPVHAFLELGPDNTNIYNSIFWGNIGDKGKPANLLTENIQSGGRIQTFQNNYLQWGLSSSTNLKGGQANVTTYTNNFTDTLIFVKPSLGYGPAFADTSSDWHIINTCINVPATYNKGFAGIKDGSGASISLPSIDLYGNKRIQLDTLDIGPYELTGLKARTMLKSISGADSICYKDKKLLKSVWYGSGLKYTWEKSANGISGWQDIQTADSSNYHASPMQSTYYRVKALQAECGRTDSSTAFLLKMRPQPQMLKTPIGDSTCPGGVVKIQSLWQGQKPIYTWEKSADGSSNWQTLNVADSANLHISPVGNQYYRIRVKNSGCTYDTVSEIIAIGLYPMPKPYLGKDTTIKQNKTLVLNPGNFSTYKWSTGDTTSSLTINGAAEPLGTKTYQVKVGNSFSCENSDTINITIEKNIGISSIEFSSWKIYPQPSNGVLNIDPGDSQSYYCSLLDMQGKRLFRNSYAGKTQLTLIEQGQFILVLETEDTTHKMIIIVQ